MSTLTTKQKGNVENVAARKRMAPLVESGGAVCVRCLHPIVPGKIRLKGGRLVSNWVADHNEDRTGYLGAAHYRCNASAGARKGNRRRTRRPRVVLVTSRVW